MWLNGPLGHLRGSAVDFRKMTNRIARPLLETGAFRPRLRPHWGEPDYKPLSASGICSHCCCAALGLLLYAS
jgi:hypothetical protein